MDKIIDEIKEERRRQIAKGYTAEHDAEHANGQIADGAAAFAILSTRHVGNEPPEDIEDYADAHWPFGGPKPSELSDGWRSDLIKAAAMIVAEIERRDRCR